MNSLCLRSILNLSIPKMFQLGQMSSLPGLFLSSSASHIRPVRRWGRNYLSDNVECGFGRTGMDAHRIWPRSRRPSVSGLCTPGHDINSNEAMGTHILNLEVYEKLPFPKLASNKHNNGKFLTLYAEPEKNAFKSKGVVAPVHLGAYTFGRAGGKLYCAYSDGSIYCVDFVRNQAQLITRFSQSVTAICFDPATNTLYAGLSDSTIRVINEKEKKETGRMEGHKETIKRIAIQPKRRKYALSVGTNEAILWDLLTLKSRCRLAVGDITTLTSVFFNGASGERLISCFRDGSIYLWDTETLKFLHFLQSEKYPNPGYRAFTMTSGGKFLFAAGNPPSVHIWNLDWNPEASGKQEAGLVEILEIPGPANRTRCLEWVPRSCFNSFPRINNPDHEEFNGLLLVLGHDHHLRMLIRTLKTTGAGETRMGSGRPRWTCIITMGVGSQIDPPIESFVVPSCSNSEEMASIGGDHSTDLGRTTSFMAVLDVQGLLHMHQLESALSRLLQPPPPVIAVEDKSRPLAIAESPRNPRTRCRSATADGSGRRPTGTVLRCKTANRPSPPDTSPKEFKDPTGGLLDRKRLRLLLKEFGHFPEKYRLFIWRSILQLPSNTEAFNVLLKKGIHPSYELLPNRYPIRSQKLMRILQKICSALAFWCPLFGELEWLPLFVFPFVKLFQNNLLHAFEISGTILTNWCIGWFEYFPNPPINILCMIENLIAYTDPELYHHLVRCQVTTEIYAWPLLKTGLSELFTQDEWLHLWDTLLCNPPGLLLATVAAYAICARGPLMQISEFDMFECFFRGQNTLAVERVIERAHQILASVPPHLQPDRLLAGLVKQPSSEGSPKSSVQKASSTVVFRPLTAPYYPIITRYPKFIVDFHIRERERIREEEKEYLRQRATVEDMERRAKLLASEEQNWYRQQELLLDAEGRRRSMLAQEEAKLREQRRRLSALLREVKLHEITLAEESRSRFRQLDLRRRKAELDKMEEQLNRLANQRIDELDAASHAAELARLQETLQRRRAENAAMMLPHMSESSPLAGNFSDTNSTDPLALLFSPEIRNSDALSPRDHEDGNVNQVADPESYRANGTNINDPQKNESAVQTSRIPLLTKDFPFTSTMAPPTTFELSGNCGYRYPTLATERPLRSTVNPAGDIRSDSPSRFTPPEREDVVQTDHTLNRVEELTKENKNLVMEVEELLNELQKHKNNQSKTLNSEDRKIRPAWR
ncbi:unnamed protein product [Calicophoron daubneyi]|uniref:TBC1 domain family member 31 n=1 Tax=Calicophoron daubneyi TaxID=300641 RepID=A0AAV2TPS4_CALDB